MTVHQIITSEVMYIDDILQDMKTWEGVFNHYYTIMLNNFENIHYRRKEVTVGFHSEMVANVMTIPNFITNIIMMRPFVVLKLNRINSSILYDTSNITKMSLKNYIDRNIIKNFRRIAPNQTLNMLIAETIEYLGKISHDFGHVIGFSFSLYDVIKLAKDVPEFDELLHSEIPEGLHPREIEDFIMVRYKRMEHLLKTHPNDLQPLLLANEGIKSLQLCQLLLCIGNKSDIFGTIYPTPISANFMIKGLSSVSDFLLDGTSGRKAAIANSDQMGKSGYFARKLSLVCFGTVLHSNLNYDCNSPRLCEYVVKGEFDLFKLDTRYYKTHPNDMMLLQINGNLDTHLIGTKIYLRTPMTCICKDGICSICYGDLAYTNHDIHIGLYAAQNVTEPIGQQTLSVKHVDTTNPTKPSWSAGFNEIFTVSGNAISFSLDSELNFTKYSMLLNKANIVKEHDIDESEFNESVTRVEIVNSKTLEPVYVIEEDNKLAMYLSPYLSELAYRYAQENKASTDIIIPLKRIEEYESLFFINVANQELSKPLKNIMSIVDDKTHLGAVTIEDALRLFSEQLVNASLDVQLVHAEIILRNIFRSTVNILEYPDWTDPNVEYRMLTVSEALSKNPSIAISLSYERIPDQLKNVLTYQKKSSSMMDAFYVL